jgi:hypothetical protein
MNVAAFCRLTMLGAFEFAVMAMNYARIAVKIAENAVKSCAFTKS